MGRVFFVVVLLSLVSEFVFYSVYLGLLNRTKHVCPQNGNVFEMALPLLHSKCDMLNEATL